MSERNSKEKQFRMSAERGDEGKNTCSCGNRPNQRGCGDGIVDYLADIACPRLLAINAVVSRI